MLKGYRATSHWSSLDQLSLLGAEPISERVTQDRNRITGAGVTSGIDFALRVVAELHGRELGETIQLPMEYDPAPPFASGSPKSASRELTAAVTERNRDFIAVRALQQSVQQRA